MRKPQRELNGSSYEWWPPRRDHVLLYKANALRFEYFERHVPDWRGTVALDVGCGGGYTCEHLARRGALVSGTDLMPEALEQARAHASLSGLDITYERCTPERLPRGDETVDVVTCFDVIEHVRDKRRLLAELHRVLRPGGWLLFDTMNKTSWSRLVVISLAEVVTRLVPRHTHDWSLFIRPEDLGSLLEESGFGPLELASLVLAPGRLARRGLPVLVAPRGGRSIMYFGATQKPGGVDDGQT